MRKVKYILLSAVPTIVYILLSTILAIVFSIVVIVLYMVKHADVVAHLSRDELVEMMFPEIIMPVTIAIDIILFITAMLVFKLAMKDDSWGFSEKAFPDYTLIGTLMIAIGMQPVVNIIMSIQGALLPEAMDSYIDLINSSGLGELTVWSAIGAIICAPFCEEVIFRGITMKILEEGEVGFAVANIIQAALFGIMHMNIIQGTYAFLVGLVLGYIYHRTGSLWASILAHLTFNLLGLYLTELMNLFDDQIWFLLMIWTMCVVSLISGIFLMKIRIRRRRHNR